MDSENFIILQKKNINVYYIKIPVKNTVNQTKWWIILQNKTWKLRVCFFNYLGHLIHDCPLVL